MKKIILVLALSLLALPTTYNLLPTTSAYAAIPHLLSYQARLTDPDGNPKPDGSYSISFRIYDAAGGGNLLWQDTYSVTLSNGIFDVLLGSGTNPLNLAFDKPYYLAIQVGSDPEMIPRQQIASVGYAYKAERADSATTATTATNADTVDGFHASATPEANKILVLDGAGKLPTPIVPEAAYGYPAIFKEFSTTTTSMPGELIATCYFYKHDETTLTVAGWLRNDLVVGRSRVDIYVDDVFTCFMYADGDSWTWT